MKNLILRTTLLLLGLSFFMTASALAAENEDVQDIVDRMKARFTTVEKYKDEGKIGETYAGYVAAVKAEYTNDQEVATLIKNENADRKAIYTHIAQQENTSPEKVGRRNAIRKFDQAGTGEWLKGEDGQWRQKK